MRADGAPSAPAVATTIASQSTTPSRCASSIQRATCSIGSLATSDSRNMPANLGGDPSGGRRRIASPSHAERSRPWPSITSRFPADFDPSISRGLGPPSWTNHLAFAASDLDALDTADERLRTSMPQLQDPPVPEILEATSP